MKHPYRIALIALCSIATRVWAATPLPFTLDDNLVHVTASINGAPVSAVLDSGTSQIILDRSTAARLKLLSGDATTSALGGGHAAQPLFPLSLNSARLGLITLRNVHGFAMDLHPLTTSAGFQVDALIGEPIFETGVVNVDYRTRQVSFLDAGSAATCADPIPVELNSGVPIVSVMLRANAEAKPTPLHLIVDLGTRHFAVMLGGPFLETAVGKRLLVDGSSVQIGTGTGGDINGSTAEIEDLTIGHHAFHHLRIALTKEVKALEAGTADGTIGVPLWVSGGIIFDYPNKRICLEADD